MLTRCVSTRARVCVCLRRRTSGLRCSFTGALLRYLPARGFTLNSLLTCANNYIKRQMGRASRQPIVTECIPPGDHLSL